MGFGVDAGAASWLAGGMGLMDVEAIMDAVAVWAGAHEAIQAAALVGSHARGTAGSESDVDFVLLATDPEVFRADETWIDEIGWPAAGVRPERWRDEDWGAIWARRVWLAGGGEVEFGFASVSWSALDPIDPGTCRVIREGCRVLFDQHGMLGRLVAAIGG